MKVDKIVIKETLNIAIGIFICSAITQLIFLICGKFSLSVFLGSLYGSAVILLNFFLMGLTVQSVTKIADENLAKKKVQLSYSMRQLGLLLLLGAGMYIAVNFEVFHWLPILLAVIYPRVTIFFMRYFRKEWNSKRGDAT